MGTYTIYNKIIVKYGNIYNLHTSNSHLTPGLPMLAGMLLQ